MQRTYLYALVVLLTTDVLGMNCCGDIFGTHKRALQRQKEQRSLARAQRGVPPEGVHFTDGRAEGPCTDVEPECTTPSYLELTQLKNAELGAPMMPADEMARLQVRACLDNFAYKVVNADGSAYDTTTSEHENSRTALFETWGAVCPSMKCQGYGYPSLSDGTSYGTEKCGQPRCGPKCRRCQGSGSVKIDAAKSLANEINTAREQGCSGWNFDLGWLDNESLAANTLTNATEGRTSQELRAVFAERKAVRDAPAVADWSAYSDYQ